MTGKEEAPFLGSFEETRELQGCAGGSGNTPFIQSSMICAVQLTLLIETGFQLYSHATARLVYRRRDRCDIFKYDSGRSLQAITTVALLQVRG